MTAGFSGGQNEQSGRPFRVSPVMTTSIPLLMKSVSTRFENYHNIIHANIWFVNGNLFGDAIKLHSVRNASKMS